MFPRSDPDQFVIPMILDVLMQSYLLWASRAKLKELSCNVPSLRLSLAMPFQAQANQKPLHSCKLLKLRKNLFFSRQWVYQWNFWSSRGNQWNGLLRAEWVVAEFAGILKNDFDGVARSVIMSKTIYLNMSWCTIKVKKCVLGMKNNIYEFIVKVYDWFRFYNSL